MHRKTTSIYSKHQRKMYLGVLSEVMTDGRICMMPSAFAAIRNLFLANIDGRVSSHYNGVKNTDHIYLKMSALAENGEQAQFTKDIVSDAQSYDYWVGLRPEDRIINVVRLTGPMTRNGDECSCGTMRLRDKIMYSATKPQCHGHIIYCNTPGGMATSLQDLRLAINYAHERGQHVYMLIDGTCASGGAFASAICDKTFFVNPEDEIGSIGMYSAFFTLEDGAKHAITSEVYHEYYATKSVHKNEWYRKASEGDMKLVETETNASLDQLLANLHADRPSITEDQMTGAMYKMKDVIGTLVDGQADLTDVANMLFADWDERQGAAIEPKMGAAENPTSDPEPEDDPNETPDDQVPVNEDDSESTESSSEDGTTVHSQTQHKETMKQFTAIPAAIGEQPMESADGSIYLQPEQAEALENLCASEQNRVADLTADVDRLNAQVSEQQTTIEAITAERDQLSSDLAKANDTMIAMQQASQAVESNHVAAVAQLETEHQASIDQLNQTHTEAVNALNAQLTELQGQLESLRQQNKDLQASVENLNNAQGAQPQAGAAPDNNGQQVVTSFALKSSSTFDPNLSAAENAARHREAMAQLERQQYHK